MADRDRNDHDVDRRRGPEPDQHDIAPAHVDGPPARRRDEPAADREPDEEERREGERHDPAAEEPAAALHLARDVGLERGEARAHRGPVRCDLLPEVREPFRAAADHAVHDGGDVLLVVGHRVGLPGRDLEVGHLLLAQAAPGRALGRHRLRGVDAAADQVEERGRELERPGLAALPQERRHERRLGVGRRLLLVLAVVARLRLAAEEPVDERARSRSAGTIPSTSR